MKPINYSLEHGDTDSKSGNGIATEIALAATQLFESSCDLLLKSTEICKLQSKKGDDVAHAFDIVRKIIDSSPANNTIYLASQGLLQQALKLAQSARTELARAALEIRL